MATVSGNLYRIKYYVVTNSANTDPPATVPVIAEAHVMGTTEAAAQATLKTNLSLSGNQRLKVVSCTEVDSHIVIQN